MKKEEIEALKKQMTKKELREYFSKRRSNVGSSMNTGTRNMKSSKDYNRKNSKIDLRKLEN